MTTKKYTVIDDNRTTHYVGFKPYNRPEEFDPHVTSVAIVFHDGSYVIYLVDIAHRDQFERYCQDQYTFADIPAVEYLEPIRRK